MQSRYTKSIDVQYQPDPPHRPVNLRVLGADGAECLRVPLPASLNPSQVGLGDVVGAPVAVAVFSSRVNSYAPTDRQWVRFYEDRGDDTGVWRNADALATMRAIWAEVQQVCVEKQLVAQFVELR